MEKIKQQKINELKEILNLFEERSNLLMPVALPNKEDKKFGFFSKYLFKRKEYKKYTEENRLIEEKHQKEFMDRRKEIDDILFFKYPEFNSKYDVEQKIADIKEATSLEELGFSNVEETFEYLITNNIQLALDEMLQISPELIGFDKSAMLEAVENDIEYIKYDKTNDEEVYKKAIEIELAKIEKEQEEQQSNGDDHGRKDKIKALRCYIEELESPKQVEEGKYKIPHKYMFEEIRKRVDIYKYHLVDGKLDDKFAKEMECLYEKTGHFVGIHGTDVKEGETYESKIESIFKKGIYCVKYNGWYNRLAGTVLYGENLSFINMLDYNVPGHGKPDITVILNIPNKGLDNEDAIPIWGSNVPSKLCDGCMINDQSCVLPKYVYGVYTKQDEAKDRHITKNCEEMKENYKYLLYDLGVENKRLTREIENERIYNLILYKKYYKYNKKLKH